MVAVKKYSSSIILLKQQRAMAKMVHILTPCDKHLPEGAAPEHLASEDPAGKDVSAGLSVEWPAKRIAWPQKVKGIWGDDKRQISLLFKKSPSLHHHS